MPVSDTAKYEAATTKYVGVNKLIREILIEVAQFHDTSVGRNSTEKEIYLLQMNFSNRRISEV